MADSDVEHRWALSDVPPPPYFHGSRYAYSPGDLLMTDIVSTLEGEEDLRRMCFATTSPEQALRWAYQRGISHGGAMLFVYEVDMESPQVDVNMHRPGRGDVIDSVMSHRGIVLRVEKAMPLAEYPDRWAG